MHSLMPTRRSFLAGASSLTALSAFPRSVRASQKFDVVVVNFLNKKNAADQRVYRLLDEKFRLFNGVFGASDEVLGAIESGVDFEKRIVSIYQKCRTPEQIEFEFDALQGDMDLLQQGRFARSVLALQHDQGVAQIHNHRHVEVETGENRMGQDLQKHQP